MVNNLNLILNNRICLLLIGILIGVLIGYIVKSIAVKSNINMYNNLKNIYVFIKSRLTIRASVLLIVTFVSLGIVIMSLLGNSMSSDNSNVILNFVVTFIFAWLLTEYSSEKGFNDKQKESSIRSYRHSVNILNKIHYTIKIVDLLIENIKKSGCAGNKDLCVLSYNLDSVKQYLILAEMDTIDNVHDWEDALADELIKYNDIKVMRGYIDDKNLQLQECEKTELSTIKGINDYIFNETSEIKKIIKGINPKVRNTIENKEKFNNEYIAQIDMEINIQKTISINRDRSKIMDEFVKTSESIKNSFTNTM